MNWDVAGERESADLFGDFEPLEVLGWYDGPRTFTLTDRVGGLRLAHWLDEDREVRRFLVVPVAPGGVEQLRRGETTPRAALCQPCVHVADQGNTGQIKAVWSVRLGDLPPDVLPAAGTTLNRPHEPSIGSPRPADPIPSHRPAAVSSGLP